MEHSRRGVNCLAKAQRATAACNQRTLPQATTRHNCGSQPQRANGKYLEKDPVKAGSRFETTMRQQEKDTTKPQKFVQALLIGIYFC